MVEDSRIYKFLAGLNVEFDEVRGRIIADLLSHPLVKFFSEVEKGRKLKERHASKKEQVKQLKLLDSLAMVQHSRLQISTQEG